MEVCQLLPISANDNCPVIGELQHQLALLRQSRGELHWEEYENELHNIMAQAEREILSEDLQKLDIDDSSIEVKGTKLVVRVAGNKKRIIDMSPPYASKVSKQA